MPLARIMVELVERVSKRSLDFANQRKAYILRTVDKLSYEDIADKVVNLQGKAPTWPTVRAACETFSVKRGACKFQYKRCGRKPWKLTAEAQTFVVKRLLAQRRTKVVTSSTLAEDLAKERGIRVEASCVRKLLAKKGYRWLPRSQKRKYSQDQKEKRLRFARSVVRLSYKDLRLKMAMSLDGVVLSMPPANPTDRLNYCWGGFHSVWRKKGEANLPSLAGADDFPKQVPLPRAIPLWGGISEGGFEAVTWHKEKKLDHAEWCVAVRAGKLTAAVAKINPHRRRGPWSVLCDNESFLRHESCLKAYAAKGVTLWAIPPKSPDCNPVEMFWGWLRRQLRLRDLDDLRKKRAVLGKTAYTTRVKALVRSKKAQTVAKQYAKKLRSTCKKIIQNKGAAAGN